MRQPFVLLVTCVSVFVLPVNVWAKGPTARIAIQGDSLSSPVVIDDPEILSQFSIWNGPGVSTRGPDGVPHPPAHLDPERSAGRFIDWPKGEAIAHPSSLRRLEVTFYVGDPGNIDSARQYVFAYEIDNSVHHGYVYLPRWKNDLIWHGVEGNWFHASERWDELIIPLVNRHSEGLQEHSDDGRSGCTVGRGSITEDGVIQFHLLDESGNRLSRWRYDTTTEGYESVREHLGDVQPGKEIDISCWPPR